MNTKTKATVATIGLGALVLSGGTLALWQDGRVLDNAKINTGHLAVEVGDQIVYDASDLKLAMDIGDEQPGHPPVLDPANLDDEEPDVERLPGVREMQNLPNHEIDLSSFNAVPGDRIRIVQPLTIDLEGHNLLANLSIETAAGVEISVADRDPEDGYPASDGTDEFSVTDVSLVYAQDAAHAAFEPAYLGEEDGGGYLFTEEDDGRLFYAVYTIEFNLDDQVGGDEDSAAMEAVATVSGMNAVLRQVRS